MAKRDRTAFFRFPSFTVARFLAFFTKYSSLSLPASELVLPARVSQVRNFLFPLRVLLKKVAFFFLYDLYPRYSLFFFLERYGSLFPLLLDATFFFGPVR